MTANMRTLMSTFDNQFKKKKKQNLMKNTIGLLTRCHICKGGSSTYHSLAIAGD